MSSNDLPYLEQRMKDVKLFANISGMSAGLIHLLVMAHFFYRPITHEWFFGYIDGILSFILLLSALILAVIIPRVVNNLSTHVTNDELKTRTDQLLGYDSNTLQSSLARLPVLMMMLGYLYFIYYISIIKHYQSQSLLSVGAVVLIGFLFILWHEAKNLLKQRL